MARFHGPWIDFMSNAFAPQPFDEFEDEFDTEAGYTTMEAAVAPAEPGPGAFAAPLPSDSRPPLQFTAPANVTPAEPVAPPCLMPVVTANTYSAASLSELAVFSRARACSGVRGFVSCPAGRGALTSPATLRGTSPSAAASLSAL